MHPTPKRLRLASFIHSRNRPTIRCNLLVDGSGGHGSVKNLRQQLRKQLAKMAQNEKERAKSLENDEYNRLVLKLKQEQKASNAVLVQSNCAESFSEPRSRKLDSFSEPRRSSFKRTEAQECCTESFSEPRKASLPRVEAREFCASSLKDRTRSPTAVRTEAPASEADTCSQTTRAVGVGGRNVSANIEKGATPEAHAPAPVSLTRSSSTGTKIGICAPGEVGSSREGTPTVCRRDGARQGQGRAESFTSLESAASFQESPESRRQLTRTNSRCLRRAREALRGRMEKAERSASVASAVGEKSPCRVHIHPVRCIELQPSFMLLATWSLTYLPAV